MANDKYLGLGLRPSHYPEWRTEASKLWIEVMTDNYIQQYGGPGRYHLQEAVRSRNVVLHGVGMNIAGVAELDFEYLSGLQELTDLLHPHVVSDHLCFTRIDERATYDLLPFAYTFENLQWVAHRIKRVQTFLNRRLSFENLSRYVRFSEDEMSEMGFMARLCMMTGCGILLDVNNILVSSYNLGIDPDAELAHLQGWMVTQYHVAGHTHHGHWLHDTHDKPVSASCLQLLANCVSQFGLKPIILENDDPSTPFELLKNEISHFSDHLSLQTEPLKPPQSLVELQSHFVNTVYTPPWNEIAEHDSSVQSLRVMPGFVSQLDVYRQCFFTRITQTLSDTILAPLAESFGDDRVKAWLANYALEIGCKETLLQDNLIGFVDYLKMKCLQDVYPGLNKILDLCLARWKILTGPDQNIKTVTADVPLSDVGLNPGAILVGASSSQSSSVIFRSAPTDLHTVAVPLSCVQIAEHLQQGLSLADALEHEGQHHDPAEAQTVQQWLTTMFRTAGLVVRFAIVFCLSVTVSSSARAEVWKQQTERLLQVSAALLDDGPAGLVQKADRFSLDVGTAVTRVPKIDACVGAKHEGVPQSSIHAVPQVGFVFTTPVEYGPLRRFSLRTWFGWLPEQASKLVLDKHYRFKQATRGLEFQIVEQDGRMFEGVTFGFRGYAQSSSADLRGHFSSTYNSSGDDYFQSDNTQSGVSLFAEHLSSGFFVDLLANVRFVESEFFIHEDNNHLFVSDGLAQSRGLASPGLWAGQFSVGKFLTPFSQMGVSQLIVPSRLSSLRFFVRLQKYIL